MVDTRVVRLHSSCNLCGTTPEQFADLLVRLAPIAEQQRRDLSDRTARQRDPGAGRPPKPFWLRLLLALTLLCQGIPIRAYGRTFGIHERTVRRYRDEVEEFLVTHGFQPPSATRSIRSLANLAADVEEHGDETVMVDGTEMRRWSPKAWADQKRPGRGRRTRTSSKPPSYRIRRGVMGHFGFQRGVMVASRSQLGLPA